jgi:benzoyl-CoA reductase/2-hydroxyglutaryl-CoA dehydratase subunit BcrC/BadD/HgdB
MDKLRRRVGTTWKKVYDTKSRLDRIRRKLKRLDQYTYRDNLVTGLENHQFLVSSSDFNGNPDEFERELDDLLSEVEQRSPKKDAVRLGYLGVPTVFGGFYELIESLGARVVFNEVQRQFSMPYESENIVDQYLEYTYPYDIGGRLGDIDHAIKQRSLDGVIHYTQTFCYRQIYDIILRDKLDIPILTIEGDRPGSTDSRTAFRIETFIEMLKSKPSD